MMIKDNEMKTNTSKKMHIALLSPYNIVDCFGMESF